MAILCLETSSLTGGAAIISRGRILGEVILSTKKTHSRRLISNILWLLDELDLTWETFDLVAIGQGPGSFTGLRIGIATAKGFAMARSLPVMGVPTLDVIAQNAFLEQSRLICPVMDARRNQVYTSLYRPDPGLDRPKRILDYIAIEPAKLSDLIPKDNHVLFIGDGINRYRELFETYFNKRAVFAPEYMWFPHPAIVGILAEKMINEGQKTADPSILTPIYCRLSEAEEKKKQNG